jgi:hypothetical protein
MSADIEARCFRKMRNPTTGRTGLVPCDQWADEFMAGLKDGQEVLVTVRKPRSVRQHRLLFGLIKLTMDNTDRWATKEVLLNDLKLATGLFETRISAFNGMPYPVPASISFGSMPQSAFNEWFQKAAAALAGVLGCTAEDLIREVMELVEPLDRRAA